MTISLAANAWNIRYSPKMPVHPIALVGGGWTFAFPVAPAGACPAPATQPPNYNISACPHVDYVTTPYTKALVGSSISMTFGVTGDNPVFDFHTAPNNTGSTPATVRFLIERRNDAALNQPAYRWWSNPLSVPLALGGPTTLLVPLTPEEWSDMDGQFGTAELAGFEDALENVGNIGMTFGGGSFFGHGVYLTAGSADFNLTAFEINP